MATAADPKKQGRFTLNVPEHLLREAAVRGGYSLVKTNHKPTKAASAKRSVKLRSTGGQPASSLIITDRDTDGKQTYRYDGQHRKLKKSYILSLDPADSYTLTALSDSFTFNLTSMPDEDDAERLKKKYGHVQARSNPASDAEEVEGEDLFGEASEEDADDDNPYDFRHYLNRERAGARSRSASPNPVATPQPSNDVFAPKPKAKPRDRSVSTPNPTSKSNLKKKPAQATSRPPPPDIRLDRKASIRDPDTVKLPGSSKAVRAAAQDSLRVPGTVSPVTTKTSFGSSRTVNEEESEDEDDDYSFGNSMEGLEIDFGEDQPAARKRAFTLPGSGRPSGGPISLRSAANSPSASQVHTPNQKSVRRGRDLDEIDLGMLVEHEDESDGDSRPVKDARRRKNNVDSDVEPISLGSPAHIQAQNGEKGAELDQDDDLEAVMIQALLEDEAYMAPGESESESEAE